MDRRDFLKVIGGVMAGALIASTMPADTLGTNTKAQKAQPGPSKDPTSEKAMMNQKPRCQPKPISQQECKQIPILAYHAIDWKPSTYSRNPTMFRNDLQFLYDNGYTLARLDDVVNGKASAEKPAILTFDDARGSQFRMEKDSIDKNCAIGIIEDFCSKHPNFGKAAMFYIAFDSRAAFYQPNKVKYKMNYLIDNGYEIGNHTYKHEWLGRISFGQFVNTITRARDEIEKHIGARISEVTSLCFPFGNLPPDWDHNKWDFIHQNFCSAATCISKLYCNDDPYRLPRLGMFGGSNIAKVLEAEKEK